VQRWRPSPAAAVLMAQLPARCQWHSRWRQVDGSYSRVCCRNNHDNSQPAAGVAAISSGGGSPPYRSFSNSSKGISSFTIKTAA
jgi:hypothetical protein